MKWSSSVVKSNGSSKFYSQWHPVEGRCPCPARNYHPANWLAIGRFSNPVGINAESRSLLFLPGIEGVQLRNLVLGKSEGTAAWKLWMHLQHQWKDTPDTSYASIWKFAVANGVPAMDTQEGHSLDDTLKPEFHTLPGAAKRRLSSRHLRNPPRRFMKQTPRF